VLVVLEVALIDVQDGTVEQFASAYRIAREILVSTPEMRSARMTHGIERPTRFLLLVEWESVEAHEVNFRQTDRFGRWRA
jgi:heme-degrading monooxygenase HmoA